VNAEFNWWLLIVGLGVGAGLTWLVLADMGRRRDATADRERAEEVVWIASLLERDGEPLDAGVVGGVLELHERWLEGPLGAADQADPERTAPGGPARPPGDEPEAVGDGGPGNAG
jgi:hypothetical protein